MTAKLGNVFAVGALGCLAVAALAQAAPFRLIQDVYPGNPPGTSSLAASGDHLFFWGINGIDGSAGQPWRSDGSTSGTSQIGVFLGSSGAYYQGGPLPPLVYQGIAYFIANDGFHGVQLWRSDGTQGGTFALTNAAGTTQSSFYGFAGIFDRVVFAGPAIPGPGYAVWATDGSIGNTQILSATLHPFGLQPAVTLNGKVLYAGSSGASNVIIVTDGTIANTGSFARASNTFDFPVAVNDIVYFRGDGATSGFGRGALWKTNGTAGGTAIIIDFSDVDDSSTRTPYKLTRVDDRVFFGALRADSGRELWVSDGSPGGTQRVKDIRSGIIDSAPQGLVAYNGRLCFNADDGTNGRQLWCSDGTDGVGTQLVYSFATGAQSAFDYTYDVIQPINGKLVVTADPHSGSSAAVPFVSDGTPGGTHLLDSLNVGTGYGVAAVNGTLFGAGFILPSNYGTELIGADAFAALGNMWCATAEEAIPDNALAGVSSRIHFPTHGGLTNLKVSVDLGHGRLGDLSIKLRHEQTGSEVVLFDQPPDQANPDSTCAGQLLDIVFDDAAGSNVQSTCANARLAYPRDQHFGPSSALAGFNGQSLLGDWTLTVVDHKAVDVGILHEWCMSFVSDLIFTSSFD